VKSANWRGGYAGVRPSHQPHPGFQHEKRRRDIEIEQTYGLLVAVLIDATATEPKLERPQAS